MADSDSDIYQLSGITGVAKIEEDNFLDARRGYNMSIPEILPANEDTNGNWGVPKADFQVSLRFRYNQFLVGEPVPALVCFRNLGSARVMWHPGCLSFVLLRPESNYTAETCSNKYDSDVMNGHFGPAPITAKSEQIYSEDLSHLFDLTPPGKYSVLVQVLNRDFPVKSTNQIVSGVAMFQIVEKLSDAEIAQRIANAKLVKDFQNYVDNWVQTNRTTNLTLPKVKQH